MTIAVFGQPGAGKSSLINLLIGEEKATVGLETDTTVKAEYYESNGLLFVDLPGYGTENFPKETYFDRFDVQSFDLFLCVTSGKFHQADSEFFRALKAKGKVCIFVENKHDGMWQKGAEIYDLESRKISDISNHVGEQVNVIFTSCKEKSGIDVLENEIVKNLDDAKRERWLRSAKAYSIEFLHNKRVACESHVAKAAWASAANGLNPVPGADIAVDITVLYKLFKEIRDDYGLSDTSLGRMKESSIPVVGRLANNVVKYAAQEGIMILLKQYAGRQTVKAVSKYIPYVGQAISAGLGYAITSNVGESYLDDCHKLAEEELKNNLSIG